MSFARDGCAVFPYDAAVARWAAAAADVGRAVLTAEGERRHGGTWFVGVDALPNAGDGSVAGVPLRGAWLSQVHAPPRWHSAQLSVVFPGYPQQDANESDAAHRYRRDRAAAHVDGLLPIGPQRRRFLKEPHSFIAGFPLDDCAQSPLVVWPGSHLVMGRAFANAFAGHSAADWADIDVTDIYQAARREIFANGAPVPLIARPGQVILLHRHLLHGVAPWGDGLGPQRMVAYFRPLMAIEDWL
ncbi:MAG: hypothetical protein AAGF56_03600 [Pseudomonadota bacterium]